LALLSSSQRCGPQKRAKTAAPQSILSKPNNGDDAKREFGTSWIGLLSGLAGSQANALGFETELLADGWQKGFNWGDEAAWESDWNKYDDSYVDAVDFVFYTGHANGDGWMLSPPNDGFLSLSEVGGPLDRWGKQDCEWIVIAACGPLQDDLINGPGGGDVFRWRPSQPAGQGVWVGALWGISPGANPGNDHIWGHGSVSADPKSPTTWIAMWLPI